MVAKEFDNGSGRTYRVPAMKIGIGLVVVVLGAASVSPSRSWAQAETPPTGTETKPPGTTPLPADNKAPNPPSSSTAGSPGTPTTETGVLPEGELRGDVSTVEESSKVPNDEKQRRSEQMLVEMRDALRRVTELLKQARGSKDVRQVNCIHEKRTQIMGLLNVAEKSSVKMYDAIAANGQTAINHEYSKIVLAHQRVVTLRTESEQCVGEEAIYTGETRVTVETGPDFVPPDGVFPTPPGPAVPPIASNF